MDPIVSIESIAKQANAAAEKFTNVNDACPYPFGTEAGRTFKRIFESALVERQMKVTAGQPQAHTLERNAYARTTVNDKAGT